MRGLKQHNRSQESQSSHARKGFAEGCKQHKNINMTETTTVCTEITIVLILLQVLVLYIQIFVAIRREDSSL